MASPSDENDWINKKEHEKVGNKRNENVPYTYSSTTFTKSQSKVDETESSTKSHQSVSDYSDVVQSADSGIDNVNNMTSSEKAENKHLNVDNTSCYSQSIVSEIESVPTKSLQSVDGLENNAVRDLNSPSNEVNEIISQIEKDRDEVNNRISQLEKDRDEANNKILKLNDVIETLKKELNTLNVKVNKLETCNANIPNTSVSSIIRKPIIESEVKRRMRKQLLADITNSKLKKRVSNIVLDVKPCDVKTDMRKLEEEIRKVGMDGLDWGESKLVPLAFSIRKLQIKCVVDHEKMSVDSLQEELVKIKDYVQSVDIVGFSKV